jgi:hypothetical protein
MDLFGRGHADKAFGRAITLRGGSWVRRESVERTEFLAFLGIGMNALFTSRSRGRRWVDHTNLYTLMAETLAELFPGALFVHALRDGRRAVHSTLHFSNRFREEERATSIPQGRIAPWAADFRDACKVWSQYVEAALEFCKNHSARSFTLVNEELTSDPRHVLMALFDFLDVRYEDGPVDYVRTTRINTSFPDRYQKTTLTAPVSPWKEWTIDQRKVFLELAAATMVKAERITERELVELAQDIDRPYRSVLSAYVPADAPLLVISRGDDELIESLERNASHFPQSEEGCYAGAHPADSGEAILHLEALRERGARYLLVPYPSMWWLDYYKDFAGYLGARHRLLSSDKNHALFAL